ncbi:hypothetical protein [Serratia marcescens]|uniref:hypothetical protein n=1 Tax=Serratia marcescens TaxID=615 RepID=UPI000FBEFFC2|nr:hypothetical protein [Serratia marcescens]MXS96168.1 hypothetical protein [Serratia marcescens]QHJ27871.1 hypothetical protein GV243_19490 [Serratia marcescens]
MDSSFLDKVKELILDWKTSLIILLATPFFINFLPKDTQSEWVGLSIVIAYFLLFISAASFIVRVISFLINKYQDGRKKREHDNKIAKLNAEQIEKSSLIMNEMSNTQKEIIRKLLSGPATFVTGTYSHPLLNNDLMFLQKHQFIILITSIDHIKHIYRLNEILTDLIKADFDKEINDAFAYILTLEDILDLVLNNLDPEKTKIRLPRNKLRLISQLSYAFSYWNHTNNKLTLKFKNGYKEKFEKHFEREFNESADFEIFEVAENQSSPPQL